jgi:hypothetical protein
MKATEIVGLSLVGLGFFVLFTRGVSGLLDLSYIFVSGVGVLAAILGLNYFNVGRQTERRSAIVDDVEPRYEVPVPGDETDELLGDAGGLNRASIKRRREFHQRLITEARETLAARGDYPSEAAVDSAVETGSWTDDPVAAWFVGDTAKPPLSVRLRGMLGSDTEFVFAAKRTIEALADVRGVAVESDAGAVDSEADDGAETADGDTDSTLDSPAGETGSGTAGGSRLSDVTDGEATGSENESAWRLTEVRE